MSLFDRPDTDYIRSNAILKSTFAVVVTFDSVNDDGETEEFSETVQITLYDRTIDTYEEIQDGDTEEVIDEVAAKLENDWTQQGYPVSNIKIQSWEIKYYEYQR